MNEDLQNEVEAINSIYGDGTLVSADDKGVFILNLPQHDASLRVQFPPEYPSVSPAVLGVQSSGGHSKKGEAAYLLDLFRDALGKSYQPGEVCLFDVIEDVNQSNSTNSECPQEDETFSVSANDSDAPAEPDAILKINAPPPWSLSDAVVELKSVFVARSAQVFSPEQAINFLQYLLDSDKKVRSATHNITAWRIKGDGDVTYQDCDDDGETAAGGRVLHLMQLMDIWNVMVVVTRWYGGHQLGPKRFSIINTVARDAFIKGGFFKEEVTSKKKHKN